MKFFKLMTLSFLVVFTACFSKSSQQASTVGGSASEASVASQAISDATTLSSTATSVSQSTAGAVAPAAAVTGGSGTSDSSVTSTSPVPTTMECPRGYVKIPHDPEYASEDFCVAKFEMKKGNDLSVTKPVSEAAGAPWNRISRNEAIAACSALGVGYHLMNNYEWQNTVQNIEKTPENWSGSVVGTGFLNIGNFGNMLGLAPVNEGDQCQLDTDKNPNPSCMLKSSQDYYYKRTHILSNGQLIWDLGGNIGEWMSNNTGSQIPASVRDYVCRLSKDNHVYHYGTSKSYADTCNELTRARNFLGYIEGSGSPVIWRGSWAGVVGSPWEGATGIFYANINSYYNPTTRYGHIGFRCAYSPNPEAIVFGSGQN